ncbi:hypothetical protein KR222_008545 [Zaprionus bogoriensis]|nr:hypothetical protein KR222_008545 [Zaprionus bogoriensis]
MLKCYICTKTSTQDADDVVLYGDWMIKQDVTVHYFCLLLSTNLLQRGGDSSGILGFLLRDIRAEATAAQRRICVFCKQSGASVVCHKCKVVFHMPCGLENRCVSHFCHQFPSYCESCAPLDDYRRELLAQPPRNVTCDICMQAIPVFTLANITYGDCCRKGFAHRTCMRRHALSSGYYLRCPWCRDKKFHDTIKLQSVYVPDRDATWERQPNAYRELHEKLLRCDAAECICPKGRSYNRNTWSIQLCILCAATGTHFKCRVGALRLPNAGAEQPDFKCSFCTEVEQKLQATGIQGKRDSKCSWETAVERIDTSYYTVKRSRQPDSVPHDDDSPDMSTDDEINSTDTVQTNAATAASSSIIELPDSQPLLSGALRPPLLLQQSYSSAQHFYLVVYEYDERQPEACTGSCTLRFALDDERLADRSEQALQQLQVRESDVWLRDTSRGIYAKVDQYTQ